MKMEIKEHPLWRVNVFQSGTHTVSFRGEGMPHYYVTAPACDDEGESGRYQVADELKTWLNGGDSPWWLEFACPKGMDRVVLPQGSKIIATGPMIDRNPPSCDWVQDDSQEAQDLREIFIEAIIMRVRPATEL